MKLDMVRRFAFIETRLLWGGGLTAQELGHAFGISRQSAQAVIDDYRNHHPGNMFLNRSTRRQEAANSFQAAYIREGSCALLDYLRGQSLVTHYMAEEVWSDLPFTDADRLTRARIPNDTVRLVITALYQKSTLSVVYQSKRHHTNRVISPNQLVFADNRYHLRAYCHGSRAYLDFVLSRILSAHIGSPKEWTSGNGDYDWHNHEILRFTLSPSLSPAMRAALAHDYLIRSDGIYEIKVSKALSHYVARQMTRIDGQLKQPLWIRL